MKTKPNSINSTIDNKIDWSQLPLILTNNDVSAILRIGKNAVYDLAHQEGYPSFRVGNSIRVPRDALRHWLENECNRSAWSS